MPAGREKPGSNCRLTDIVKRKQLGTRAELKHISNGTNHALLEAAWSEGSMDSPHQWRTGNELWRE